MGTLIAGLVLLLGVHSIGFVAGTWRKRQVERVGERAWKGLVALVSLVGLALVIVGFAHARASPVIVWDPPSWMPHLTALFATIGFILVAAAYVPGTRIKAALGHPMVAGVKSWAFGHLIGNGTLAGIVLFGALLAWTAWAFALLRRRDRATGKSYPARGLARDAVAIAVGVVAAIVFALTLHGPLIGLRPFG